MHSLASCFAAAFLVLVSTSSLWAQNATASLVGVVRDPSGAVLPGASIKVVNSANGEQRAVTSSGDGIFNVVGLNPGTYDVSVTKAGFRPVTRSGVDLEIDQAARIEFDMAVGSVQDTIEVQAVAPLVQTENAVRGEVIAPKEISEMPLTSRDFLGLALMSAGVQSKAEGQGGGPIVVGGTRPDNTNFVVDGFSIQNPATGAIQTRPPIDSMQEFKVLVTNYSAEYGRLAGGVVTMALKGGGNRYHGTLFEFLRNDAFDARSFFDQGKTKLRQNQYGLSLDGPVRIPKIYNGHDKTFFAVTWERVRIRGEQSRLTRVPTALERAGNFTQTVDANGAPEFIKDPLSTAACTAANRAGCFANNIVPTSRFSPIAQKMMQEFPAPNTPGVNNFYALAGNWNYQDWLVVKLDHHITAAQSVSFRYTRRGFDSTAPFGGSDLGTFGTYSYFPEQLHGLTHTWVIRPTMLLQSRIGRTTSLVSQTDAHSDQEWNHTLGIPYGPTYPVLFGYPRVMVRGYAAFGTTAVVPQNIDVRHWDAGSTLTWARGKQTIKAGFDYGNFVHNHLLGNNSRGTYNFLGRWSNDPLADFEMGLLDSSSRQVDYLISDLHVRWDGLFIQDDYKITPKLTLNLGLRYELLFPAFDGLDRLGNYIPQFGKVVIADDRASPNWRQLVAQAGLTNYFALAKDYGLPRSLVYLNKRDFGPRIGLAWRPFGGTRTVLRSGYGMYYATSVSNPIRAQLGGIFPFVNNQNYNRVVTDPNGLTLSDPFPAKLASLVGTTSVSGYELSPKPQTIQNWNFTLEREVIANTALEIGYAGSKGTHLGRSYDINQPFRSAAALLPNGQLARPVQVLNAINLFAFNANSSYNSATATLRRRFAAGFLLRVSYTYAKSIDDASSLNGAGTGGFAGVQDVRNLHLEHGLSDFDLRHMLTSNFIYEIPSPHFALLRGWQIAGSVQASTGTPYTPRTTNANVNLGEASRPNRIRDGSVPNPAPERWFDRSAFPVVPTGAYLFGNSGRNILIGPGSFATNLALSKRFKIADRSNLQFRWEAFNATNHTNFHLPNTSVDTLQGGIISAADGGRTMQLALKFVF